MFSKYYQSELAYLREMGAAFGLENPAAAGMLAERSGDPDVERLLEGVAFLTGRIREKIDDSVPEVIHHLTQLLFPHFLRPQPSASIVEFSPNMSAIRSRLAVPRHTGIKSKAIEKTSCQFRTTQEVQLIPASVSDVVLDRSKPNRPELRLMLEGGEGIKDSLAQPGNALRLYLHGELAVASTLRLWLLRHCDSVYVRGSDGTTAELGTKIIRPVGFDTEQTLVPWPEMAPQGIQFLQEYFSLPEKFMFVDLLNVDRAIEVVGQRFEIVFRLNEPPELVGEIQSNSIRLHCTPAINLFETSSDPLSISTFTRKQMIRAAGLPPDHMEVYSINNVVGIQPGRRERRNYQRFFDYTHSSGSQEQAYYQSSHVHSPINDGLDQYLEVNTPRDVAPNLADEVLSLDITCTNRSLPRELRVGDISIPGPKSPALATFKNITPVTSPVRPPMGKELHWRLVSHLAMNYGPMANTSRLRDLCNLYNFQAATNHQSGYSNSRRCDGIAAVHSSSARRILDRAMIRGVATTVELDSANYSSIGETELFGGILNEFFAARIGINSFHELTIKVQPFNRKYQWQARNGQLAIV